MGGKIIKMTKNKILPILIISFLAILVVGGIVYFGFLFTPQALVGFSSQCSLDSCPDGYIQTTSGCNTNTKSCTKTCVKQISAHCSDVFTNEMIGDQATINKDDVNGVFYDFSLNTATNKCYSYGLTSEFIVSDRRPCGLLTSKSDSHKVLLSTNNNVVKQECSTSLNTKAIYPFLPAQGGMTDLQRGNGDTINFLTGVFSFKDSSCSQMSCGSEGSLTYGYNLKTSDWIPAGTTSDIKTCTFECNSGEEKCEGTSSFECNNYNWENQGQIEGKCGYTSQGDTSQDINDNETIDIIIGDDDTDGQECPSFGWDISESGSECTEVCNGQYPTESACENVLGKDEDKLGETIKTLIWIGAIFILIVILFVIAIAIPKRRK